MTTASEGPLEVSRRLRCCVCGQSTEGAEDYVAMTLSAEDTEALQAFGAHASCLNGVFAPGFTVEVHLM